MDKIPVVRSSTVFATTGRIRTAIDKLDQYKKPEKAQEFSLQALILYVNELEDAVRRLREKCNDSWEEFIIDNWDAIKASKEKK